MGSISVCWTFVKELASRQLAKESGSISVKILWAIFLAEWNGIIESELVKAFELMGVSVDGGGWEMIC